jgi:hypothetical protein
VQKNDCVSIAVSGTDCPGTKNGSVACRDLDLPEDGSMTLGYSRCLILIILRKGRAFGVESPFGRNDACDSTDTEPDGSDADSPEQTLSQQSHTRANTLAMPR